MIPLLKIYDDFTSNKYVSMGISVASTAFMAFKITSIYSQYCLSSPLTFVISACAGVAFALLAKTYIIYNERIKTEGERNSLFATLSLVVTFIPASKSRIFQRLFEQPIANILHHFRYNFHKYDFLNGFGIGFLITNLALQILEGKTKIEFQSPIKFS